MNQSLMNSVESTCQELSETPKGSAVYPKLLRELQQLQTKWKTIHTKFLELKDQPGKKLEAEFDTLHGQTLTDLDKIQRGLKKLKLESSEPKNVKSLLDKCVVCGMCIHRFMKLLSNVSLKLPTEGFGWQYFFSVDIITILRGY